MELPEEPTAAELAAYLQSNGNDELNFLPEWYRGMATWTPDECAAVVDAAERNRSVCFVDIDIDQLSPMLAAGIVSSIFSGLRRVKFISIFNSRATCNPPVVDALLDTIVDIKERGQSAVTAVRLIACSSPNAFLDFHNRFPNLVELGIHGHCACNGPCVRLGDFLWAVATCMGRLPSLRLFYLQKAAVSAPVVSVLNALKESTTVETLVVSVANASNAFLKELAIFCGIRTTVKLLCVRGSGEEFLDVSPLFDLPLRGFSFSPSIQEVEFSECELARFNVEDAATMLKDVQQIFFLRCHVPAAFDLCLRLPRLTVVTCAARRGGFVDGDLSDDFNGRPYTLETNEDLVQLCRVVERKESLVRFVEIDLVCREPSLEVGPGESFPAIGRLLRNSRGELVVNFGNHTFHVCELIASALTRLRADLSHLRLQFFRCSLDDHHYAELILALQRKVTLKVVEIGFDTEPATADRVLGDLEHSMAALESLVQVNDTLEILSLRGLSLDQAHTVLERVVPVLATTNRSLRGLDLHNVDLTDRKPEIIGLLLPMLQTNHVFSRLHDLDISSEAGPEAAKVGHLLRQNWYGRRLLHKNPDLVPAGIWPTILAKISKDKGHTLMYAFVRVRPDLVRLRRRGARRGAPGSAFVRN